MPYLSRYLLSNRLSLSQGKLSQSKQYSPRLSLQSLIPHFIGLPLTFLPLKQPGHFLSFRKRPRQIPQFIPHGAINSFFIDTFYQTNGCHINKKTFRPLKFMAPGVGFEPTTNWLTANCSTAELPGNIKFGTRKL